MTITQELEQIAKKHNGLLRPADVVQFAKNESTRLHSCFEWDDTKAAEAYRLAQARNIIRVNITVIENAKVETRVRAFYSLPSDRTKPGGGYRRTIDVMSSKEMAAELLEMARQDMLNFREKYRSLTEVQKVIDAINEALETPKKKFKRAG